jgi:uncharacterized Zn-finger protein
VRWNAILRLTMAQEISSVCFAEKDSNQRKLWTNTQWFTAIAKTSSARFVKNTSRGIRQAHSRSHEDKREFECKVCGKCFKTKSCLSKHQRQVHQSARNFKCPQCEKSFKTNKELKQHSIFHSEIKEFECSECGKLFRVKSELQRHLRTHTDKKQFKCETCNKEFKTRDGLTKHKLNHSKRKSQDFWLEL